MRFLVYGAGAVGGVVGGLLAVAGHEVALVARGAHLAALRRDGLRLITPDATHELRLPAAADPAELGVHVGDVVLLAVKGPDTEAAVQALQRVADPQTPIACLQNGVANERAVLRRFANTYGICVMLPATHLDPGVVRADCAPTPGILDIGRFPSGTDATAAQISGALRDAGFASEVRPDVMAWKHTKLLMNLGNAVDAVCERTPQAQELRKRIREEGERILTAAGIPFVSWAQDDERRGDLLQVRTDRSGGSSWQSLTRGTGAIETDYLNGEIVLLARERGLDAPLNERARRWANLFAADGRAPNSLSVAEWYA
ncbi:MAG: 2-dehydropantoate 2-reductase [Hamadaea sp.]|nr:2-dehydropantoate 2-reductase [Hamadaea sp.]